MRQAPWHSIRVSLLASMPLYAYAITMMFTLCLPAKKSNSLGKHVVHLVSLMLSTFKRSRKVPPQARARARVKELMYVPALDSCNSALLFWALVDDYI